MVLALGIALHLFSCFFWRVKVPARRLGHDRYGSRGSCRQGSRGLSARRPARLPVAPTARLCQSGCGSLCLSDSPQMPSIRRLESFPSF